MEYDIIIVGGGPAGLACAIKLAQCNARTTSPLRIALLEKGAQLGAHTLSGALLDTCALDALLPQWRSVYPYPLTPVRQTQLLWLGQKRAFSVPFHGPLAHKSSDVIISISQLCRWLGTQAETLGIDIYPGVSAAELLHQHDHPQHAVIGVCTGEQGRSKQGKKRAHYQAGWPLRAKQVILAEGSYGYLTESLIDTHSLRATASPQIYGLGLKEVWQIPPAQHQSGLAIHSLGWPLGVTGPYGGGFIYHWGEARLCVGLVVGLDYRNPYLDPFACLQQLKSHPAIYPSLKGGECLHYGARVINEGGWQSLPRLVGPGFTLIGCAAGTLNVARLKGLHLAMQSGILAAQHLFEAAQVGQLHAPCKAYEHALRNGPVGDELRRARNIRMPFKYGLLCGMAHAAFDHYLLRGQAPWTYPHTADHTTLQPAHRFRPPLHAPTQPDVTLDKSTALYLSNTTHDEDQPTHLVLHQPHKALTVNAACYASPETRYCPAGVYEMTHLSGNKKLQINAANCLHCKACAIKDPTQNIQWVLPQGGDGPQYTEM